jgi:hypothetical protein
MRSVLLLIAAYVMSCGAARAQEACPTGPFATDPAAIAAAIAAHPVWPSDWEAGAHLSDVPAELTEGGFWFQAGGLMNYGGVMARYDAKRYVIVHVHGWWGDSNRFGGPRRAFDPLVNQAVEQVGNTTYTITVTRPTPIEARHFACLANRFLMPTTRAPGKDPTCSDDDTPDTDGHFSEAALLHEGQRQSNPGLSCAEGAALFDSMDRLIEDVFEEALAQAAGTWRAAYVSHLATDPHDNLYLLLAPGTLGHGATDIIRLAPSGRLAHLSASVDETLRHPIVFTVDRHGHPWVSAARMQGATVYDAAAAAPAGAADWAGTSGNAARTQIGTPVSAIAIDARNHLYALNTTEVLEIAPDGTVSPYVSLASFRSTPRATDWPSSLVVAADGTLYVSQSHANTILKVSPQKVVTLLAGSPGESGATDGPGARARFDSPAGLALDRAGMLYVADSGNGTIRRITPTGQVSTVVARGASVRLNRPTSVAIDSTGTLYVTGSGDNLIRKVSASGVVTTLDARPYIDAP